MKLRIPYGTTALTAELPEERVRAVLTPEKQPEQTRSQEELVEAALANPIGSPPLWELARKANRVLILSSDHTRPVPSRILMPRLLREIRRGNPEAEVVILIATGCHRDSTREELIRRYGEEIVARERLEIHHGWDDQVLRDFGTLPSGGRLRLNWRVDWADLIVAEGFIEPHFFAGFSGGRKAILPGVAARETVLWNHNARFIAHPKARTGVLEGNPIHRDMLWAARQAGLGFLLNVALDEDKRIIGAWAGDREQAHLKGCAFMTERCRVPRVEGDIVITSNGGAPLDQNLYQAVKGMTAAEACVRPGGVIIMVAECADGHGGEAFYRQCSQDLTPQELWDRLCAVPMDRTEPDQWQTQIFARVLCRARVIFVTGGESLKLAGQMHLHPAASLEEALTLAERLKPGGDYVVIPNGVDVIVEQEEG